MALVKYGGGVIQLSGSMAGNTFARNRSGNYLRARTKPINPNTSSPLFGVDKTDGNQNIIRSAMAALTVRWSATLTADQRTAWNLYAASVSMKNKLGEAINLTGFNHYLRSNIIRYAHYNNAFDDGPTLFELPEKDPSIVMAPQMAGQICAITFDDTMDWVDEDDAALQIWEGQPQNPQRNFFGGPYLGLKDKAGDSGAPITSPESMSNLHILTTGQKVWYKLRIRRADGRLSEPWYTWALVIAGA